MALRARSKLSSNAPTLGFLVDFFDDGYQAAIAVGAARAAKNAGAAMHSLVGGIVGSQVRSGLQRNHVFELVTPSNVDGLVILGGSLINHVGPEALTRYCERYRPLPMCSIGAQLGGMSSVLVDNEIGMRSVVEHLLIAHAYKRIAFVRGPLANDEAELRFRVYRETLQRHGIAFDERMVVVGDFLMDSGRAAVKQLFDERHLTVTDIDAIVASNDSMAFGILEALKERGLRVPTDIAVTGFDDVEQARYTDPGLTTVRQPLEEQGREAVRVVLAALHEHNQPQSALLRTSLVVRGSCGCGGAIEHPPMSSGNGFPLAFEAMLVSRRQHMLAELARCARGSLAHAGANWEARLVTAVVDDLRGQTTGTAIKMFEGFVHGLVERGLDVGSCHDVLDGLRHEILACLCKEPERREIAEDLFHDIRLVIARSAERLLGGSRIQVEQWARQLSVAGARLIGTFDLAELGSAVETNFPSLGIASCYIVMYETGPGPAKFSELVLAYDRLSERPLPCPMRFPTEELLPIDALGHRELRNFVFEPLFFKQEVFGYLAIDFDVAQVFAYEAIRDLISASLKGAMLLKDVRKQQVELETAANSMRDESIRRAKCMQRLQTVAADIAAGALTDASAIGQLILDAMREH